MKHYHQIGIPFNLKVANGEVWRVVARECETIHDKKWNEDFRKTCKGCVCARIKSGWCSGHGFLTTECLEGGCKNAKCSPEYREDGKFIHYKRIIKK